MADLEESDKPAFHAGFPNAAADAADVPLDLNRLVVRHPASTFYMRVESNSWENLGVNQGDILVIDRSLEPKASDLAVVTDGEGFGLATIPAGKRLADTDREEINVWGVVAWVIHQQREGNR